MKKVLVTGAKGMLGQDLCPILEASGYSVVKTDIDTMDITDYKNVSTVLGAENPDIVIHCAAYTNVDKAEKDIDAARLVNSNGTENIAKVCAQKDIVLVYISTDYVFDGTSTKPYLTTDKPNPLNNYGLTKLEGEEAVKKYCKKYFIARSSWLYGLHGKNFVETMLSLAQNPEIKVVDDQIGSPTSSIALSNGIIKILSSEDFGIHHICGQGATSWYNFAKEIFSIAGLQVNLVSCKTEEFPRPAKRPHYSVMNNNNICPDWKESLKNYMQLRNNGENR